MTNKQDQAALAGPLAGVRVIDLSAVLMGPYATQIFGDHGADVIKIESPEGDSTRWIGPGRHPGMGPLFLHLNRNKRSVALDLKTPQGAAAMRRLIEGADVFVHNLRPASIARLGLDYYNHNLDSAPDFYGDIITTRDYQDRLDTLERVRGAGVKVCCGGIVGMGETRLQRAGLIAQLANLDPYPESVPINNLVPVPGTPLADQPPLDPFEFVRTIAVARLTMPLARVRLSAGRQQMGDAVQALCFLAGANSIFYGDKLLTTGNPDTHADLDLLQRLGLRQATTAATA